MVKLYKNNLLEGETFSMRTFWKVFSVSFVLFFIAMALGSYSYLKNEHENDNTLGIVNQVEGEKLKKQEQETELEEKEGKIEEAEEENEDKIEEVKEESFSSIEEAFKNSKRINVVIMGMENVRTDTIIFLSFDLNKKDAYAVSIPRDTYIHRKGYDLAEQRKINAIYESHGPEGMKQAVSYILHQAPVHHYVVLNYEGVKKIVDALGGVEVVVPFDMKYQDLSADPPLRIDLKAGRQILNGDKALQFLRYRKGYIEGDLGRIKAQQEFLKSLARKALSLSLPVVIKNVYEYVETDISPFEALYYATKMLNMNAEDIKFVTLPGQPEFRKYGGKLLSYFIFNSQEAKKLIEEIYNVKI